MRNPAHPTRDNRTITVDFQNEATYVQLRGDRKAFVALVLAFIRSLGFQRQHQATCRGGRGLTRHSHDVRVRLGGVTIWRLQCTPCTAVCTVLPHCVLRDRQRHPEVAREALVATHGGLSVERCAVSCHRSPMALYGLIGACGPQRVVVVRTRCGLPLAVDFLADEKPSHGLTDKVSLPTIVCGRVIWSVGDAEEASAAALTQSDGELQRAAFQQEPSHRVRGIRTDGFDRTTKSLRTRCPGARRGKCLRHAITKLPKQLAASASPARKAVRSQFHTLWYRARQRKGLRVCALGQRLRHFVDHVAHSAGVTHGERVRRWFQEKQAGWYAVRAAPQMPVTSPRLDQAHHAIERKLFAMKGVHHPRGNQQACLTGLVHRYNLVPYQRRAQHGGQCAVEVEGGTVPTRAWWLTLQILTSGGYQRAAETHDH
jgi:hypothetical protein